MTFWITCNMEMSFLSSADFSSRIGPKGRLMLHLSGTPSMLKAFNFEQVNQHPGFRSRSCHRFHFEFEWFLLSERLLILIAFCGITPPWHVQLPYTATFSYTSAKPGSNSESVQASPHEIPDAQILPVSLPPAPGSLRLTPTLVKPCLLFPH
jgi:hypothetical protein